MTRLVATSAAIFVLMLGCAHPASFLSEQQARAKAIRILKGAPYGRTPDEASKNIKQIQFAQDENTKACGAKRLRHGSPTSLSLRQTKINSITESLIAFSQWMLEPVRYCVPICRC